MAWNYETHSNLLAFREVLKIIDSLLKPMPDLSNPVAAYLTASYIIEIKM